MTIRRATFAITPAGLHTRIKLCNDDQLVKIKWVRFVGLTDGLSGVAAGTFLSNMVALQQKGQLGELYPDDKRLYAKHFFMPQEVVVRASDATSINYFEQDVMVNTFVDKSLLSGDMELYGYSAPIITSNVILAIINFTAIEPTPLQRAQAGFS